MTYRCKTNPTCVRDDLPNDLAAICACAAECYGKISKAEFQRLREIEVLRKMREAQENIVLDNVSAEVGRLVAKLNQSEAA